jgi:hypothetical protein
MVALPSNEFVEEGSVGRITAEACRPAVDDAKHCQAHGLDA